MAQNLTQFLTNIANAIRAKKGTSAKINAADFATEIENLPSGGDTSVEDGLVSGTIATYSNNRVSSTAAYSFYNNTKLTSIDLPNITTTGTYSFYGCTGLTNISFPKVTSLGSYTFRGCSGLTSINLPLLKSGNTYVFYGCSKLKEAILPSYSSAVSNYMFQNCSLLEKADVNVATSVGSSTFASCYSLKSLILRKTDKIATLSNTNAFTNCYHFTGTENSTYNPSGAKDGYIYVADNLVDSYKAATNWSTYSTQIKPLSELPGQAITFTVDGTTYQGLSGMTWTEWVASEYNDGTFTVGVGVFKNGYKLINSKGLDVTAEDILKANEAYTAPKLVFFYVDGQALQMESGMTWSIWIDSQYNKDGYYRKENVIGETGVRIGSYEIYNPDGTRVRAVSPILEGTRYTSKAAETYFTINGTIFYMLEPMTWDSFIMSDYNPQSKFTYISDVGVHYENRLVMLNGVPVGALDMGIVPEGEYTLGAEYVPITTINFSIDGVQYQADGGMTWAEWLNSDYNVDGYKASGSEVTDSELWGYVLECTPNDTIIANKNYQVEVWFVMDHIYMFTAGKNMTWREFVNSTHNNGEFTINGNYVIYGNRYVLQNEADGTEKPDNKITWPYYSSSPELPAAAISFLISDGNISVTYTAKERMTWEEWLASDYNTDGLFYSSTIGGIIDPTYSMIRGEKPTNAIKAGTVYMLGALASFSIKHGGVEDPGSMVQEFYATGETWEQLSNRDARFAIEGDAVLCLNNTVEPGAGYEDFPRQIKHYDADIGIGAAVKPTDLVLTELYTCELYAPSNTIKFTIDGVQYEADPGMTWQAWCMSAYNTGDFNFDPMGVYDSTYTYPIKDSAGMDVTLFDPISNGGTYSCKGSGGATFFIDGVAYGMTPGTTWIGWVNNSAQNTIGARVDDEPSGSFVLVGTAPIKDSNNTNVQAEQAIVQDGEYYLHNSPLDWFSVGGVVYNKPKNITWIEFINSPYNTGNFYFVYSTGVVYVENPSNMGKWIDINNSPYAKIESGKNYSQTFGDPGPESLTTFTVDGAPYIARTTMTWGTLATADANFNPNGIFSTAQLGLIRPTYNGAVIRTNSGGMINAANRITAGDYYAEIEPPSSGGDEDGPSMGGGPSGME